MRKSKMEDLVYVKGISVLIGGEDAIEPEGHGYY